MILSHLYCCTVEARLYDVKVHTIAWSSKETFSDVQCGRLELRLSQRKLNSNISSVSHMLWYPEQVP